MALSFVFWWPICEAFCRTECLVWLLVCQCYGIQQLCERAAEVKPHKIGFLFIFIFYHRCRLSQNYFYVRSSLMRYTWNGDLEHIRRIYNMPAFYSSVTKSSTNCVLLERDFERGKTWRVRAPSRQREVRTAICRMPHVSLFIGYRKYAVYADLSFIFSRWCGWCSDTNSRSGSKSSGHPGFKATWRAALVVCGTFHSQCTFAHCVLVGV